MSRVLLINARICSPRSARLPLSLLHLGAVLEGRHEYTILDGNLEPECAALAAAAVREQPYDLVGLTVMPGPQVGPSIAVSQAVRSADPRVPIVWGGYFPTLYTGAALNAPYVDYVVRGQARRPCWNCSRPAWPTPTAADSGAPAGLEAGPGCRSSVTASWSTPAPQVPPADGFPPLPYHRAGDLSRYLHRVTSPPHGLASGGHRCRYRCSFCGVGCRCSTATPPCRPASISAAPASAADECGADGLQFVDHNFFDSEAASQPLIEALVDIGLPWWAYARADALSSFSAETWQLLRRSQFRMAYIGAEAAGEDVLRRMRKGTVPHQTLEAAARCREHGVIPELSFVLGGPEDPESEAERTLQFVKQVKRLHPEAEIILYIYTPTPQRDPAAYRAAPDGVHLPQQAQYGPDGPALPRLRRRGASRSGSTMSATATRPG